MTLLTQVVETAEAVAATRSRKAKTQALAELLTNTDADEVATVIGFLSGDPGPERMNVGHRTIAGLDVAPSQQPALTVREVREVFGQIAGASGPGSATARREGLTRLLSAATASEQSFLSRLLTGNLRQGSLEGVMIEAVALASGVSATEVRRAVMVGGALPSVGATAVTTGDVSEFTLQPFVPVQPMLASTAEGVVEAVARFPDARVEAKLDGVRLQIHFDQSDIRAYTRNLRDVTDKVPEVRAWVRGIGASSAIVDAEIVMLDEQGRAAPFQVSMARFASEDSTADDPMTVLAFDLLMVDGEDLTAHPLEERLRRLTKIGPRSIDGVDRPSETEAADFLRIVLERGDEGVMVKDLTSSYEAGRRGSTWLKVKPAHTLDLVILAAEWGSGRRRGWLSNLHLGARHGDEFVMLGKTFKGLTDQMLGWQTEHLLGLETHRSEHVVWVRPELVVEVAFDGVQASSRYPGGMALRFARVKGHRPDKSAEEADTIETVRGIFEGRLLPG